MGGRARLLAELFALAGENGGLVSGSVRADPTSVGASAARLSRGSFNALGRVLAAAGARGGALDWESEEEAESESEEARVLAAAVHLDAHAFAALCGVAPPVDEPAEEEAEAGHEVGPNNTRGRGGGKEEEDK